MQKQGNQMLAHPDWWYSVDLEILLCINFGHPWQQTGKTLKHHVFSTGSKGTTAMQKPGNNAKAFWSSQAVHKKTVES